MEAAKRLTNLQIELLEVFKYELSEEQIKEIRSLLVNYFAEKVTNDIDKLSKKMIGEKRRLKSGLGSI